MDIDIWKRTVVLVADDNKVASLEHDDKGLDLLNNEEVTIIPMREAGSFLDKYSIASSSRIRPGMLLIISPFDDNKYLEIENVKSLVAIQKMSLISRLSFLLGAKSLYVNEIKIKDIESSQELSFNAEKGEINGELKAERKVIEKMKNEITLTSNFKGGKPNIKKAEGLLNDNRLSSDIFLKNLFETVKDSEDTDNEVKKVTQEICITQSLEKTFELVATLKLEALNIKSGFKTSKKTSTEIYLNLTIEF